MQGAADLLLVPDPTTFQVLPWAAGAGWVLCDLYFANGRAGPFRHARPHALGARRACEARLRPQGGNRSRVSSVQARGWPHGPRARRPAGRAAGSLPALAWLSISDRAALRSHGAGARTDPPRRDGARPAVALDRSRIRSEPVRIRLQALDRTCRGRHDDALPQRGEAGRPAAWLPRDLHVPAEDPNVMSSGWHLHQSLVSRETGENAFISNREDEPLSALGRAYMAGLLAHARASTVFDADDQRLQALSLLFACSGPGDLGTRQSWRDDPCAGRPERSRAS